MGGSPAVEDGSQRSLHPSIFPARGMELTGDLVYLQIAGIFGWACTPVAFQVVARALKWELSHVLQSMTEMYVDDIIAVCMDKDLSSDLITAKGVCTRRSNGGRRRQDRVGHTAGYPGICH